MKEYFLNAINDFRSDFNFYKKIALLFIGISSMQSLIFYVLGQGDSALHIIILVLFALAPLLGVSKILAHLIKTSRPYIERNFFPSFSVILPSLILYGLYNSLIVYIGIFLLVIPGFLAMIYFHFVPIIAAIDPDCKNHFFKASIALTKKNLGPIVFVSMMALMIEILTLIPMSIKDPQVLLVVNLFLSVIEAFLTIILTIISFRIYEKVRFE